MSQQVINSLLQRLNEAETDLELQQLYDDMEAFSPTPDVRGMFIEMLLVKSQELYLKNQPR